MSNPLPTNIKRLRKRTAANSRQRMLRNVREWGGRARHSQDMAARNYFAHQSPDGRTIRERVSASHYKFSMVGENLAGGDPHVASAVRGWIDSPSHCANMMDPRYRDVAVSCVGHPRSDWGTYWTMVLGRKR